MIYLRCPDRSAMRYTAAETWRRLCGGRKNFFRGPRFQKCPFSRPKFLMTFFRFCVLYCDKMSYTNLSSQEKPLNISEKNSLIRPFFTLFILSRASDNTTCLNIGVTNAWAVPHLKFC